MDNLEHYAIIGAESIKLGFKGICPESLAALEGMVARQYVTPDVCTAYHKVVEDLRQLFAPVKE